ncbi:dihydrolipoyl dehydrogenase family protein [Candidatus Neptunichlamydia sp. REUL1]|uniref:dihydrolipoyl dehydrogenase family protein n=1 Tax=Candidatus Neptunichlamydia sp. REUL1 TaxID=3064277 RepID=UPI002930A32C|nr:NAD(P)/FAD-dependent oxidoreductase [Candidatus Neptunochlamydia sp. REUL1]
MNKIFDIIIIGAGAGGLVVAIGAAKAGKKVLLVERNNYGGDCTNFGCIPSKSLIASAHTAHVLKHTDMLGIETSPFSFDGTRALDRVRNIVHEIRSHEDPSALKKLGVETLNGTASFIDKRTLSIDGKKVQGQQIVIATGSYPIVPSIKGLKETPFLTNETVFDLEKIPKRMIFIGGGPICSELSQAFSRLGAKVTMIESRPSLLAREEKEIQKIIMEAFQKEGIILFTGERTESVSYDKHFTVEVRGKTVHSIEGDALFVGVGRRPRLKELMLDAAHVKHTEDGIPTDSYGRTNIKNIWAIGDVTGPPFFTHYAENQARTVLTNLLLPFIMKKSRQPIPRCTYTDPEVASIGLKEEECHPKRGCLEPKRFRSFRM